LSAQFPYQQSPNLHRLIKVTQSNPDAKTTLALTVDYLWIFIILLVDYFLLEQNYMESEHTAIIGLKCRRTAVDENYLAELIRQIIVVTVPDI
jgi:hypothetical protein